jgi:hypoxanthine phosphoribosyltransferase
MGSGPLPAGRALSGDEAREVLREADLVCTAEEVDAAFERMATEITEGLAGSDPVVLAVMLGGMVPTARLISLLEFPFELDYVHATRYRGGTRGRDLRWIARPSTPLAERTVLVVDDILDEGHTLAAILEYCAHEGARRVLSAVLVHKQREQNASRLTADITGLEVPDRYVFGCGMDYGGMLRNLPAVYAVKGL